jgi:hypothetical protein
VRVGIVIDDRHREALAAVATNRRPAQREPANMVGGRGDGCAELTRRSYMGDEMLAAGR